MDGRRKALIVANDDYEDAGLRQLLAPAADAAALSRVLGDPNVGGFEVQVVHNEPAHAVQAHVEDILLESRPEEVLLLHFSCHGLKSESGELFFAARNTRPNRLGSTATSADFVQRCMRGSRSRSIVLMLDCCYGGAFSQGVAVRASGDAHVLEAFPTGKLGGGRGRAVITASSSMEYAFEENRLTEDHADRPSVFTSAIVEGLSTGDADRDEDGLVSLNELYDYVFDRVREQNPHQTPSRDVEMEGDLYIARSGRRRVHPQPIPADLDAARADSNMYTRLGAVAELRARLISDDLPVALGAYEVLAEMARTDVRFVAEPAQAAIRETIVRPAETEVDFGRVAQGSQPPYRMVLLSGPAIARAGVPHTDHDWLKVSDDGGGLVISVDTSRVGSLRGTIDITGPTGNATITVGVDLIQAPATPAVSAQPVDSPAPEPRSISTRPAEEPVASPPRPQPTQPNVSAAAIAGPGIPEESPAAGEASMPDARQTAAAAPDQERRAHEVVSPTSSRGRADTTLAVARASGTILLTVSFIFFLTKWPDIKLSNERGYWVVINVGLWLEAGLVLLGAALLWRRALLGAAAGVLFASFVYHVSFLLSLGTWPPPGYAVHQLGFAGACLPVSVLAIWCGKVPVLPRFQKVAAASVVLIALPLTLLGTSWIYSLRNDAPWSAVIVGATVPVLVAAYVLTISLRRDQATGVLAMATAFSVVSVIFPAGWLIFERDSSSAWWPILVHVAGLLALPASTALWWRRQRTAMAAG